MKFRLAHNLKKKLFSTIEAYRFWIPKTSPPSVEACKEELKQHIN